MKNKRIGKNESLFSLGDFNDAYVRQINYK